MADPATPPNPKKRTPLPSGRMSSTKRVRIVQESFDVRPQVTQSTSPLSGRILTTDPVTSQDSLARDTLNQPSIIPRRDILRRTVLNNAVLRRVESRPLYDPSSPPAPASPSPAPRLLPTATTQSSSLQTSPSAPNSTDGAAQASGGTQSQERLDASSAVTDLPMAN